MVIPFTAYLQKILDFFGKDSKEYFIASLYNGLTARDDFGAMKIMRNIPYDNGRDNILFCDKLENCYIILNTYKTSDMYGKKVRILSPELRTLLISYIERNRLADYLFPDDIEYGLSRHIIDMKKKINIDGGINYIRHSKVSEFLKRSDVTPEMRLKFSCDMCHSESMQQKYKRGVLDENLKELCDITL
jgi:hypothetical protein